MGHNLLIYPNEEERLEMKKLKVLLLSVGILFTATACGGEESKVSDKALDALETAIQNAAEMKSASYSLGINAKQEGEAIDAEVHGAYNFESSLPEFSLVIDVSAQGSKVENFMSIYVDKEFTYMNMMNIQKEKKPLDMGMIPDLSFDKKTFSLPKSEIKKYLKEASIDGNKLSLVFDVDKINKESNKLAAKGNPLLSQADDTKMKEIKVDVTLKDKKISKAKMNFASSSIVDGEETGDVKGSITLTLKNIGSNKKVEFPKDLDTYPLAEPEL